MAPKDPYLEELDVLEDHGDSGELPQTDSTDLYISPQDITKEDATKIDIPADEISPPAVKTVLDLSPDLSVAVVVVLGRKNVTVKDLLELRMGQVVEIDKSPSDAVDIVAAGKVIGKGELVDVDGKLGVRILKLLK